MHLTNLMVNYLYRKYGVPIHNFTRKWSRGTSYLKMFLFLNDVMCGFSSNVTFVKIHTVWTLIKSISIHFRNGRTMYQFITCQILLLLLYTPFSSLEKVFSFFFLRLLKGGSYSKSCSCVSMYMILKLSPFLREKIDLPSFAGHVQYCLTLFESALAFSYKKRYCESNNLSNYLPLTDSP